jgi:putative two-component system response regulator
MPDLILSDLMMPKMDGFTFLQAVRQLPDGALPTFLFLSAYTELANVQKARLLGADDFLFKPFSSNELLRIIEKRITRREQMAQIFTQEAMYDLVGLLAETIASRDPLAAGHARATWKVAEAIAKAIGLDAVEQGYLHLGCLLQNIGMITIPRGILNSPRRLSQQERALIRQHPLEGERILERLPLLEPVRPIVRHHHERWDGNGYPDGLAGKDIPLLARIVGLADAFVAMTHDRPYRLALPREKVLSELKSNAGQQFDPDLAEILLQTVASSEEKRT